VQPAASLFKADSILSRKGVPGKPGAIQFNFTPWFLKSKNDSDWTVYYWLSRSWVPVNGRWVRANGVILAGQLGSGDRLRSVYPCDQPFLDEEGEAQWIRDLVDSYVNQFA
jgi:hypothetical protein